MTKEQVEEYGIPGNPSASKVPKGWRKGRGAKGYETQRNYSASMPGSSRGATGGSRLSPRRVRGRTGGVACDVLRRRPRRPDQVGGPRGASERRIDSSTRSRSTARRFRTHLDELHQGLDRYDDEMGPHVDAAIDGLEQLAAEEKRVRDECGIRERRDRVEASSTASITGPSSRRWTYRSPTRHRGLMTRSSTRGGPFSNS